ncbi:DHA14-like major facilitator [Podospora conica]|nr:DHA14-like major facilitator [Schizothecium conicum]
MDDKLAVPAPSAALPESEAATIAATSIAGDEKTSIAGEPASDADITPSVRGPTPTDPEKRAELERQTTAVSKSGQEIDRTRTREDGTEYPTGPKLALIILALCLSIFLMALDNSIIATAIPKITEDFQSLQDVGWYGSSYLLTTAALQLLFGRIYTFFSVKWVYLTAIIIFELGSLICAVAQNSVTLIVGRAISGVGSAGLFSGALIILAYSVPLAKRPIYSGAVGSMYGIASVSGPLLGGVFTDKVTWRWCFWINLPIGAITILVIAVFFPDPRREITNDDTWQQRIKRFDPIGTAVFMPAIISLLLALQWGGTTYAWSSWRIIFLLVLFGVLIAIFLFIQYKQQDLATVPPRIFFKQSVWASSFFSFCLGAAFLGSVYYLPIWFQAVKGASAVQSGIMNLPMLISVVVMSMFAGAAVTIWGYYTPFMLVAVVFTTVGYGLLTTFSPSTPAPVWIGYQILAGVGIGLGMQQPLMAVQTVLEIDDVPTGTAVVVFMQTLGGALFVSIAQNVFTNKLVEYVAAYAPAFGDPMGILAIGATSVQKLPPGEVLEGVTRAYNDSLTKTFVVFTALSGLAMVGAVFTEWRSVKGKKVEMVAA